MKDNEVYLWLKGLQESETQKEMALDVEAYLKSLRREINQLRKELRKEKEYTITLRSLLAEVDDAVAYFKGVFLPRYEKIGE